MKTRLLSFLTLCCLVVLTLSQDNMVGLGTTATPSATQGGQDSVTVAEADGTGTTESSDNGGATQARAVTNAAETGASGVTTQASANAGETGATKATEAEGTAAGETNAVTGATEAASGVTAEKQAEANVSSAAAGVTEAPSVEEDVTTGATLTAAVPVAETTVAETVVTSAEKEMTTQAVETVTMRIWPDDDPCSNHTTIDGDNRHYTVEAVEGQEISDKNLEEGWYGFTYKEEAAIITPICIKEKYCSTYMPYHLKTDTLPEIGETLETEVCGPGSIAGKTSCCLQPVPVKVRNCQTKYIFYLKPINIGLASVCIQLKNEDIPAMYYAIPKEEEEVVVTTAEPKPTLPSIHYSKLSSLDGVVTAEFSYPEEHKESDYLVETFDPKFRQLLADQLNNMNDTEAPTSAAPVDSNNNVDSKDTGVHAPAAKPTTTKSTPKIPAIDSDADMKGPEDMRRRRRDTQGHTYKDDDVKYVGPTPRENKDKLQVTCYVEDPETGVVPTEKLLRALEELEDTNKMNEELGLEVVDVYEGLPTDVFPAKRIDDTDVWVRHRDLLIALIALSSICLLVIIIGVCCLKCRSNKGSWDREDEKLAMEAGHGKKRPIVHENPLPDSEIMRGEDLMVERENPAVTSNGGGQHISKKDDDNGWVVPIDELSKAEKEKPEVEDTKL